MSNMTWGSDPLLRALRAIAVLAFLAMLFVVVLDPDRSNNGELLILLFGSILVALSYPVVMSIPGLLTRSSKAKVESEREKDDSTS